MAVFTNELKLDTSSFQASLKKVAADGKATAQDLEKSLGSIDVGIDTTKAKSTFDDLKSNAKSALSDIGAGITGGIIGGGVVAGVQAAAGKIVEGFQFVVDKGAEFETQMAALSAVTGVTGDDLAQFGDKAKELASRFGGEATTQLGSFQTILSKFGPDLAKTPEALNAVTENVNILSKAAGLDAKESVDALSNAMLQFGIDASDPAKLAQESGRFINVLAASAKVGAAEIPQVAEAILQAGVAAKGANLSFEETNAAIQALAVGGKVGSEAGVGLRNVLGLLIKQSGPGADALASVGLSAEQLGATLTSKGLSAALTELQGGISKLGSDAEKAAFKATLFGTENASTAGILLDNIKNIEAFTAGVTGTNEAFVQAEINMATFSEMMSRFKADISNAAIGIFQGFKDAFTLIGGLVSGTVGPAIEAIAEHFSNMWSIVKPILMLIGGAIIAGIVNTINFAATAVRVVFDIMNSVFDGIIRAIQPVIDAVKRAFGMDGAFGEGMDVMKMFSDFLSGIAEVMKFVGDIVVEVGKFLIEFFLTPLQGIAVVIGGVITKIREWIGVSKDSNAETQKGAGLLDTLRTAFTNIKGTIGGVTEAFREIKTVISEFFAALGNLDIQAALKAFTGFGERVGNAYSRGFNEATGKNVKAAAAAAAASEGATDATNKATAATQAATAATEKDTKKTKEQASAFDKAKEALKAFTDQQKEERKVFENKLKAQEAAGTLSKAEVKLQIAEFDKKQAEERIAKVTEALSITAQDPESKLAVKSSLALAKDENEAQVIKTANEIILDAEGKILDLAIAAIVKPDKKGNIVTALKKLLSAEEFNRQLLAAGVVFGIPITIGKIEPPKQSLSDQILGDLGKTAADAVTNINWKKVFKKPEQASKESIDEIGKNLADGTLTYQDAVKKLNESVGELPTVFDLVVQQLNASFTELTNKQIASLATVADSYSQGKATSAEFYNALAQTAGAAFAQIITEQEDYGKATLSIALDTLEALIPVLVAQITGINLANPAAPFGTGLIVAAALSATLYGLVAAAKASVSGFAEGGYTGNGGKYEPAGIVHRGEFVVNANNTRKYRGVLEAMNNGTFSPVVTASSDALVTTGQFNAMHAELAAIRQRLDSMPNGIYGKQSVSLDVGFDSYLYQRDQRRSLVRRMH
jgi:TP901 family phage tail tape measure protein/lambda family phage tail tape measure protein